MSMEDILSDIKKHHASICKQIEKHVGKEKSIKILKDIPVPTGGENPQERAVWAAQVSDCLEHSLDKEQIVRVRQGCACVQTNKYSAYNKKYFPELRQTYSDDEAYMKAVAAFLSGRPRIGAKVEYSDGKFTIYLGEGKSCGCFVIKGGWDKPTSTTWCYCCQGTLFSVLQFVYPTKICHMEIIESHATGGKDCVFSAWYTDAE